VADLNECKRAVSETKRAFGALNGLVNNASIFSTIKMKPFWEISETEWDELMAVNLRGAWQMTKAALLFLLETPGASIINISSSTVLFGRPNYAHYVSSKAGIIGLSRAMARELGSRNIRVNSIMPGPIFTEIPRGTAPTPLLHQRKFDFTANGNGGTCR
jgi:NAD(P)-dependent dehydrogenase (short-subunit alcohol dehydrogenase family)